MGSIYPQSFLASYCQLTTASHPHNWDMDVHWHQQVEPKPERKKNIYL